MARAFSLSLCALVVGASCSTTNESEVDERERPMPLDQCLGDQRHPLTSEQLAQVRSTWEQIASGAPIDKIAPLPLLNYSSGQCTNSWWTPIEPLASCEGDVPVRFWPLTMRAGPVVFDASSGTWSTRSAGDEPWFIDDHVVLRRWPPSDPERKTFGDIDLEIAGGTTRKLKGFPERILDDGRAIVRADPSQHLVDTRTGRTLLDIKPRNKKPRSVAGTVVVGSKGNETIGALDFGDKTWTAFAVGVNGKHVAQVDAEPSNVAMPHATRDGAIVLAAWRPPELDVVLVRDGKVALKRTEKLEGIALSSRDAVIATGEGATVAVGLGATLVVLHAEKPRVVIDTLNRRDSTRTVRPLHVLAGGNVVLATADGGPKNGTLVVDAREGIELARVDDREGARIFDGGARALLLDPSAQNEDYVVLIDAATATITRGKIGETKVGRFTLRTFAGIVDPARVCSARLLDKMPPLLMYGGDAVLPAALVR